MSGAVPRWGRWSSSAIGQLALLGAALAASGCPSKEGDLCGLEGGESHCEGGTLVECRHQRNNPATLEKTSCSPGVCVARASLAACVASEVPCDPKAFVESCVDGPSGKRVRVCQEAFTSPSISYPRDLEPGCLMDGIRTCSSDGKLAATDCTNQNRCAEVGNAGAAVLICAESSTPCDPKAFQSACLLDGSVVVCRPIAGTSGSYPFALPPDSPEAKAAGCS